MSDSVITVAGHQTPVAVASTSNANTVASQLAEPFVIPEVPASEGDLLKTNRRGRKPKDRADGTQSGVPNSGNRTKQRSNEKNAKEQMKLVIRQRQTRTNPTGNLLSKTE